MEYKEEISSNSAVCIRNLCKSYSNSPPILRNICMNVKKGSIYGLLGPSGCGKTSLLSCIVGAHKWDSGDVIVFGKRSGSILGRICGYMPQDSSLYESLTFNEMAVFFGKLYNMPQSELHHQVQFLTDLLQVASIDQVIGTLSGGEQRRVSLALTFIHSPDLLILDEPTVGLDALLRKSIWEHLNNLALNQGKTVVITTHYTNEAKLANQIGIMRNGRLLAENTPENLIQTFNCNFIEDVMLKLCRTDDSANKNVPNLGPAANKKMIKFNCKLSWKETIASSIVVEQDHSGGGFKQLAKFDNLITENLEITSTMSNNAKPPVLKNFYHELKKVHGITAVQSLNILRQKIFLAFFVLLPTFQGSIMFNTMGKEPREMKFGVVNQELLNWTAQCNVENFVNNSCDFSFLSCKFLHEIQRKNVVILIPFRSENNARTNVLNGVLKGYLTIPNNYSADTLESFTTRPFASNESMDGSKIKIHLDFSKYVEALFMLQHFFDSHAAYLSALVESCQLNRNIARIPFEFRKPVYESLDDSFTEFFVPGLILCAIFNMAANITAILYIEDRNNGTLGRGLVAGLKTVHVFLGYFITQGFLGILQTFLWSLTCYIWLDYSIRGSAFLYIFICLLVIICGIALGLLIGVVCSDAVQSLVFGMFLVPASFFYGGVLWPLEGMPRFSQYIAYVIPTTLPTRSLRSVVVRGLNLTHALVWPGVVAVSSWIIILVFILTVAHKR